MGIKDFAKNRWNWLYMALSAMIAEASLPAGVKADDERVLERLRPMQTQEETIDRKLYNSMIAPPESALAQSIDTAEDFSKNRLWGVPQKYANWYLADLLMVLVHEQGHFDEMYKQKGNPSLWIQPMPFWVNAGVNRGLNAKNKEDEAKTAIAGFVNAGNLAEYLKGNILLGNVPKEGMRFMSMLALASELNLPFYLGQHYMRTAPDNGANDIENFSQNTGISPKTMAISSGIHMLVNAPYIYHLAKNAVGSNPTAPKKKDYFFSFRYDGDSYMIYFHSDFNTIIEKLQKPRFMLMHGEN